MAKSKQAVVGGLRIYLEASLGRLKTSLNEAQKELKKFGKRFEKEGENLSKAFSLPLAGIGTAAILAATNVDKAFAQIRRGTGATGSQLKGLQNDFRAVFRQVDDSAEVVGQALADLNTRTGAAGKELQGLTKTMLDLAEVSGKDVNGIITASTRLFGDWGIATKDATATLDNLWRVSQSTGIGIDELAAKLTYAGAPLRQFGFDLETSAALLGKWEKEGVNAELLIGGLRVALGKLSAAGINDVGAALAETMEQIKAAGTAGEANSIARALFGSRNAADMAAAIRENRFEVGEFLKTLREGQETIGRAADESETFAEKLGTLRNALTSALDPFGSEILKTAGPILQRIAGAVASLGEYFSSLSPRIREMVVVIGGIAIAAGPVILAIGAIATGLASLASLPVLVVSGLAGLGAVLYSFREQIGSVFRGLYDYVVSTFQAIGEEFPNLTRFFELFADSAWRVVSTMFSDIVESAKLAFKAIGGILSNIWDSIVHLGESLKTIGQSGVLNGLLGGPLIGAAFEKVGSSIDRMAKRAAEIRLENQKLSAEMKRTAVETGKIEVALGKAGKNLKMTGQDATALEKLLKGAGAGASEAAGAVKDLSKDLGSVDTDPLENGLVDAHENAVAAWRGAFENAITGVKFDLQDALKQVAVGFAAEIAASVSGGMQGVDSPQDFGASIARQIMGAIKGAGGGDGKTFSEMLFGRGRPTPDTQGPLLESGDFDPGLLSTDAGGLFQGANSGNAYLSAGLASLEALSKVGQNTADTTRGVSTAAFAAAGAYFGGPIGAQIGAQIGTIAGEGLVKAFSLGGPTNKETLARIEFQKSLGDMIEKVNGLELFDTEGNLARLNNIRIGSVDRFNDPNWPKQMDAWGDTAKRTFLGLGEALRRTMGITEDIGGQLGMILGENLLGNIDNARLAVMQLGVSFEDLKNAMLESAKAGDIRWHEYNVHMAGLADAFKSGLEGFAAMGQAFDNFVKSGGRGMAAVKSVRDMAVEAMEAGYTELDQLAAKLKAEGKDAAMVDAIIAAARQRGISNLQGLADASDETAGAIAGDVEALNQDIATIWQKMGEEIDDISKKLKEIPEEIKSKVKIEAEIDPKLLKVLDSDLVKANGGSAQAGVTPYADGGVVSRPTLSLMGEAGPEAILPLQRIGGKLGVRAAGDFKGGGMTIQIDARGASPGVEARIMGALSNLKRAAVEEAVNVILDGQQRGRFRGAF